MAALGRIETAGITSVTFSGRMGMRLVSRGDVSYVEDLDIETVLWMNAKRGGGLRGLGDVRIEIWGSGHGDVRA